jgi:hypothetical protein
MPMLNSEQKNPKPIPFFPDFLSKNEGENELNYEMMKSEEITGKTKYCIVLEDGQLS